MNKKVWYLLFTILRRCLPYSNDLKPSRMAYANAHMVRTMYVQKYGIRHTSRVLTHYSNDRNVWFILYTQHLYQTTPMRFKG